MMRLRRILRELAQEYHIEGFSEHELIAFCNYYDSALNLDAIRNVYERTPDKRVKRAALLLLAFRGNNSHWPLFRDVERTAVDPFLRELAQYARHLIDPREAALDDMLDALANVARRMSAVQPVYQPRLF